MRSIVLSLLLLLSGVLAGGAAHAQAHPHSPFAHAAARTWIEPAVAQKADAQARPPLAILRKCQPHLVAADAVSAPGPSVSAAEGCNAPLQVGVDDRHEMIWLDSAPAMDAVDYRSPRNAIASAGLPPAWLRAPLRPPRA